jgi:hypothetical protein
LEKVKKNVVKCCYPLLQDNGSAKYFQGTRHTTNMGEKVAQVSYLFEMKALILIPFL